MNKYMEQELAKIDGIDSFCYQNCLRIIMELQGIKHSPLYLNASLALTYNKITGKVKTPYFTLLGVAESCVEQVLYLEDRDPREVFEENLAYIKENDSPIAVSTDTYYFAYAPNYKKHHARHIVILCGWDEKEQSVEIIDWYPDWFFKGKVPLDEYLASRVSENEDDGTIYSGKRVENAWFKVEGINECEELQLLDELLETIKREYYKEEDDTFLYGPQAMEAMKTVIDRCLDGKDFDALHKRLWFIEKRYRFLRGYLGLVQEPALATQIERTREALNAEAEAWNKLLLLSVKGCVAPSTRIREKMKSGLESVIALDGELKLCLDKLERSVHNIIEK